MSERRVPWLRIAIWSAATIVVLGVGALLFAASGLYSVAASRGHFAVTTWLLEFGMRRSVSTHSLAITVPLLDDPDMIRLGAGHYHGGCAQCHGAPGEPSDPIVAHMLPPPPNLARMVPTWSAAELFWIVKNGLKYTGMPAWTAQRRDDEVWAVVAFLRRLPKLGAAEYRALAAGNVKPQQEQTAPEMARSGSGRQAISACARCHGDATAPPASRLIPRLAGQSARYLESSLTHYFEGLRPSGIMQPVAAELDADAITRLSEYYAGLPASGEAVPVIEASPDQIERGQRIAATGVQASGIPPCLACHAGDSAATFPRLAGQHARYIVGQLRLFRDGVRNGTTHAAIMRPIARRLTEQQMQDVAAYFESLAADAPGMASRHGASPAAPEASP